MEDVKTEGEEQEEEAEERPALDISNDVYFDIYTAHVRQQNKSSNT